MIQAKLDPQKYVLRKGFPKTSVLGKAQNSQKIIDAGIEAMVCEVCG
jgi:hypothetical protein